MPRGKKKALPGEHELKDKVCHVRFEPTNYMTLEAIANERGFATFSEFVRQATVAFAEGGEAAAEDGSGKKDQQVKVSSGDKTITVWTFNDTSKAEFLAMQLKRIGNLLNQQTRAQNRLAIIAEKDGKLDQVPDVKETERLRAELEETRMKVEKFIDTLIKTLEKAV